MRISVVSDKVLIGAFILVFSLCTTGCVHQQPTAKAAGPFDSRPTPEAKAKPATPPPAAKVTPATPPPAVKSDRREPSALITAPSRSVVEEQGNLFRIIETPFGMVKQAIGPAPKKAESENAAAEKAATPARSDKSAKKTAPLKPSSNGGAAPDRTTATPSDVTLNFDNADLYEVIRTMAEILHINYMVDPNVSGQVSIHTAGRLSRSDLLPIFYQILEANGLTAVKEGPVHRIVPIKEAPRHPLVSRYGRDSSEMPPAAGVILQLIPLRYIDGEEMTKILTPFISADGTIVTHSQSNTLLVADRGINVLKVLRLVEAFDIDIFTAAHHQFFKIENSDVEEISKILTEVLSAYQGKENDDTKLIPIKHMNILLAISKNGAIFEKITQLLKTMDIPARSAQPQMYVYSIKSGSAKELSDLLNMVFKGQSQSRGADAAGTGASTADGDEKKKASNPLLRAEPAKTTAKASTEAAAGDGIKSGTLRGDIRITADEIRNALIIEAIPSDYDVILGILAHLDVMPRQVLLEAVIAEIELGDEDEFGVDWNYERPQEDDDTGRRSQVIASIGGSYGGLAYTIGETKRWSATLKAKISENKANILSAPTLLASNDKEAKIDIADEIPIPSKEYQYESNNNPLRETSVEYRTTGLIFSVIPHINQNGLVSLEINHELSEYAGNIDVAGSEYPQFKNRSVVTHLTVDNNQTIVIGGLISTKESVVDTGVPVLRKIPLLGRLFGTTTNTETKRELIIMLTPRVIVNLDDVDEVSRDFKAKLKNITY